MIEATASVKADQGFVNDSDQHEDHPKKLKWVRFIVVKKRRSEGETCTWSRLSFLRG